MSERFDPIFEHLREGVVLLDGDDRCARVNRRAGELLGRAPGDLRGLGVGDALDPGGAGGLARLCREARRAGREAEVELDHPVTRRRIAVRIHPDPPGLLLLLDDATAKREAEAELRRQQVVFETLSDAVVVTDAAGRVTACNPAAEEAFGYAAAELLGQSPALLLEGSETRVREILDAVAAGGVWRGEMVLVRRDGERRTFETRIRAVRDAEGRLVGTVGANRDVTDQRAAERELVALVGAMSDPVFVLDREGRHLRVASSGTERLYRHPDEILGRTLREVLPAAIAETLHAAVRTALDERRKVEVEYSLDIRGTPRHFLASASPMDAERVVWVARDITERHVAEEALRAREEQLHTFVETIPDHAWMKDREGRYRMGNGAYLEAWGRTLEELVGRTDAELFPPELARDFVASDRTVMETRQRLRFEHRLVDPVHGLRWHEVVKAPLVDAAGEVAGTVGISRDITHRKQAEEDLRETEARFRQLADHIPQAFWIARAEPGGEVLYASPAFAAIWGIAVEEVLRGERRWFDAIHPEDRERVLRTYSDGMTRGEPYEQVYRLVRPGGEVRWIRDRGFPVAGPGGEVERFAGVAEDITERRSLEAQLRQSQKLEGIGRLAGGIAHDFNNMLLVIQGFASLLGETIEPGTEAARHLGEIQRAAERSARLTRQLLAYGRRQILRSEVVDLNAVAGALESMLRRMIGEDVAMTMRLDPDLPPVEADRSQVEQVILNLVVNARDAMPDGGTLLLRTAARTVAAEDREPRPAEVAPGAYAELLVRDTGTGMSPEVLSAAFEPFFTTKPVGEGTGLGLSTVYGIVRQSGGHVWAESEPGRGTTVRVLLPRAAGAGAAAPAPPPEAEAETQAGPAARRSAGATVLVVEDEDAVRRLLTLVLTGAGYRVLAAASGEEAGRALAEHAGPLALALVDVVLPGERGVSVAERVRALRPGTPVVLMSGYTDDALLRRGVEVSEHRFLPKPIHPSVLLRTVEEILESDPPGDLRHGP